MDNKNFHVDIKGLVFNSQGHIMLLKEPAGTWDLPGGRMEYGEDFEKTLMRECQEEMGVSCKVLDDTPFYIWPSYWKHKDTWLV